MRSTEGTYHFLAPECTTGEDYDPYKVDIWALGVTIFAMLVGTLPFGTKAASLSQVMDSIREDPLVWPEEFDAETVKFLTRMLEKDPETRITIPELKAHQWICSDAAGDKCDAVAVVEVTQQEIEAAFTPVNNFILMVRGSQITRVSCSNLLIYLQTKLKMKMASRLGRARRSIGSRHEVPPLAALLLAADTNEGALMLRAQSDRDIPVDAPVSPGRQRRATTVGNLSDTKHSPTNLSPEISPLMRITHGLANIPSSVVEDSEELASPMPTSRLSPRTFRVPAIDCKLPPLAASSAKNSPPTSPACSPSHKHHSFPTQGNSKDVSESMRISVKSQLEYLQLQGHDSNRLVTSASFWPTEAIVAAPVALDVDQSDEGQGNGEACLTKTDDAVQSKQTASEGSKSPSKSPLRLHQSLTNLSSEGSASLRQVARRKSSFDSSTGSLFTCSSEDCSPPKRVARSPSANEYGSTTELNDVSIMQRSSSIARALQEVPLDDMEEYVTDAVPATDHHPATDESSKQRKLSVSFSNSPAIYHDVPVTTEELETVPNFRSRTVNKLISDDSQRAVEASGPTQDAQQSHGPSRMDLSPSRQLSKSRLLKKLSMLEAQESIRLMLLRRKSSMMRIMQTQHTEEQQRRTSSVVTHKPVAPPLTTCKSTSTVLAKKNPSPRKSRLATARNTTVCNLM